MGIKLLELIDYPYYEKVRKTYLELAEKYGKLADPTSSWGVITGTNKELQIAIQDNGLVDQAFYDLTSQEIQETYTIMLKHYES